MITQRMSADLGLTPRFIWTFAQGASHAYRTYYITKRGGGTRTIHYPSKQLKAMQRWLNAFVIEKLPVHPAATAYRKNKSIFDNASLHASSKYLLRMDCRDFFPSMTEEDVRRLITTRPALFSDWDSYDVEVFCKLVCREGRLAIGAPSSPGLSNALCFDMDAQLTELSGKQEAIYTRYADDLIFSTMRPNVLRGLSNEVEVVVTRLALPANLAINSEKTRHSSKRRTRRVTGIVLGSDSHPHVGRALKRRIRAMIHKFDSLDAKSRSSLAGLVAYAAGFDADFLNSLIQKYSFPVIQRVRFPTK
jgi:RNA-directed DNA polymerase